MERKEVSKENQVVINLVIMFIVIGFYALYVYNKHIVDNPVIIHDLKFWGKTFILMIPIVVVAMILLFIVYSIIYKIVTREDVSTKTDEMDKLIDLKALKISRWVYSIFFVAAMGSLALGKEPWIMVVILISSCFMSAIAESISRIYYYRNGI